jgi:hypothetical protein
MSRATDGAGHVFQSANRSGAVTKSDSTVLKFKSIYVGGAGNVTIKHAEDGSAVEYVAVPVGTVLPVCGCRVMAATTATNLVWMDW